VVGTVVLGTLLLPALLLGDVVAAAGLVTTVVTGVLPR
jgi:hypothetical protein